jgi:hypothetical protein
VGIEYNSGTSVQTGVGGKRLRRQDTSISPSIPAYVSLVPGPESLASMWISDGCSSSIITLDCPVLSLVDIDVEAVLRTDEAASNFATTAGAALGTMGALALAAGSGTGLLNPISMSNIGQV